MKDIVLLAIETSCDETAVALVKNGTDILANIVSSQIKTHALYGGVVPEVASRLHIENISLVIAEALEYANLTWDKIDGIAFTQGPGLIGSLHVGVQAAKTLAWMYDKPLIAVGHIYGHIMANQINEELEFPLLALVVSGGHTELVLMKSPLDYSLLGSTQDDAVGEAFDKVARIMGLPYPGGVAIDKLAKEGQNKYTLPIPKIDNPFDFSFSGLKSAVLQLIAREEKAGREVNMADLAYSFQDIAVLQLLNKARKALESYEVKQLVLAGGVAANSHLRSRIKELLVDYPQLSLVIPNLAYCTDNAAMIGAAGYHLYKANKLADLSYGADPGLEIV